MTFYLFIFLDQTQVIRKMSSHQQNSSLQFEFKHKVLFLINKVTLSEIDKQYHNIWTDLKHFKYNSMEINLSQVTEMDSAGVAFIHQIQSKFKKRKTEVIINNASQSIQKIIDTFSVPPSDQFEKTKKLSVYESLGQKAYTFISITLREFIYLTADLFYWTFADLFQKKAHRKGEFVNQAVNIGVNAVPIVGLLAFMIGLVLALQSAAQLRQFGANIFIVDLVVIALTAEMGPLLTAVVIAGRSGSAIASEIATMTVTEEIDALKSMGLNPLRYIVIPKMHASIFSLPFLVIFADILGIIGGMVVASVYLDVSFTVFYNRMSQVLLFRDIATGFFKSLIFAGLIVETGAFFGFRVTGGSEGVGKSTTKAVVVAISLVIIADSIMGLFFY